MYFMFNMLYFHVWHDFFNWHIVQGKKTKTISHLSNTATWVEFIAFRNPTPVDTTEVWRRLLKNLRHHQSICHLLNLSLSLFLSRHTVSLPHRTTVCDLRQRAGLTSFSREFVSRCSDGLLTTFIVQLARIQTPINPLIIKCDRKPPNSLSWIF